LRWRQAKWPEPLITEYKSKDLEILIPFTHEFSEEYCSCSDYLPSHLLRDNLNIPTLSEIEIIRHFIRLSQMSYGIDTGPTPLGSCTMKYNPKICDVVAMDDRIVYLHPLQDEETVQGILELLYIAEKVFTEITGMDRCSFQPPAGAAGEFVGTLMIKKYHELKGEKQRDEILVPDSAHGTNPASAAMAGFKVVNIPTAPNGCIDLEALRAAISERTAGLMLTNPNTLGIFEKDILKIADMIHNAGGLLYYDGANLNAILGIARPGDMGFDIIHLNLHKTFASPHGGGGPGGGVICAKGTLVDLLPRPLLEFDGKKYYWDYRCDKCIGRIKSYYGNIISVLRALAYILSLGPQGLREVAEISIINTNYFLKLIKEKGYYELIHGPERYRMHECVISARKIAKETGVTAEDISKALMDRGLHPPIMYFPLIVEEALMVELTETETIENIEYYAETLNQIAELAYRNPEEIKKAPQHTSVKRLDLVKANHPKSAIPSTKYMKRF